MTYSNGVQELAGRLHQALTTQKRPSTGEDITVLDDAKEEPWMSEVIMAVHNSKAVGDVLPDDAVYALIDELAGLIADDNDIDDCYEPDIYTSDLNRWMANFPSASEWFDQAVGEYGYPEGGYTAAIQLAQGLAAREVGAVLVEALEGWVKSEAKEVACFSCGESFPKDEMFHDDFESEEMRDYYCLTCAAKMLDDEGDDAPFTPEVVAAIRDARLLRDTAAAQAE